MSTTLIILYSSYCPVVCSDAGTNKHSTTDESARDLPQIKDSGELVVLTLYSSTSYFIYRGQEWDSSMNLASSLPKVWD